LATGAAEDKAAPAPAVRVAPASFDFGRTLPHRTLRKEFTLRNAGERDLVIEKVTTSCGCTAAIAGETTLKPGRTTPLTVTLETRDGRGRIERKVLVRSNDPATPLLEVAVSATVAEPGKN
jgi:hypothetical protein